MASIYESFSIQNVSTKGPLTLMGPLSQNNNSDEKKSGRQRQITFREKIVEKARFIVCDEKSDCER